MAETEEHFLQCLFREKTSKQTAIAIYIYMVGGKICGEKICYACERISRSIFDARTVMITILGENTLMPLLPSCIVLVRD